MHSTIWSGRISTDLLRFSMGRMPVNYVVHTCPRCGWSGQEERPDPASPEVRRFVREYITPMLEKGDVPPWRKWEYYALIKEAAGAADLEIGSAFLIAAQCARLGEKYERERQYRLRSVDHYLKAMEEGGVPEDSLYQTTYLIGELFRRIGDTWKSRHWFKKVLDMDIEHERREFFVKLTRQQMTEPRNFIDEEHERESRRPEKRGPLSRLKKLLGVREVRY